MKLNIAGCRSYIGREKIKNMQELSERLGLSIPVILLLEQGKKIGYDAVKDIFNSLCEAVVREIIDFGEETMDGFQSKYVLVGDKLY